MIFHNFNIGAGMATEIFTMEIEVDGRTQKQRAEMPLVFAQAEFMQTVQQFVQLGKPARVKFSKSVDIWCQFDKKHKKIELFAEFWNNIYEAQRKDAEFAKEKAGD